jgi:hypothetical protein
MNYIHLPPGRNRMLSYSNYINNRRSRTQIRRLTSPIRLRHVDNVIGPQQQPRRNSTLQRIELRPLFTYSIFSYQRLSELEDIKIGLLSKNLLHNSTIKNNIDNDVFCVICQDKIEKNEIIRTIKCSHGFHINCIDEWFTENKKCPTCKFEL